MPITRANFFHDLALVIPFVSNHWMNPLLSVGRATRKRIKIALQLAVVFLSPPRERFTRAVIKIAIKNHVWKESYVLLFPAFRSQYREFKFLLHTQNMLLLFI